MAKKFIDEIHFAWNSQTGTDRGKSPTPAEARIITTLSMQPAMSKLAHEANGLVQKVFWSPKPECA